MRRVRLAVLASLSILATSPALAQAPQVEKNISMAMALAIIQGTLEQCTKDGYKVSVVIVDKAGNIAASVRGDGTNPHTMEFGRLKAYTARTRGQTSLEFMKVTSDPANAYLQADPEYCRGWRRRSDQGWQRGDRCGRRLRRAGRRKGRGLRQCRHCQGGRRAEVGR